jgi:hypothetical protein
MPRPPRPPEEVVHRFCCQQIKELVVYQKYTLRYNVKTISQNLRMSIRTVERTLQLWRTTGEVVPKKTQEKQKRRRILTDHEQDVRVTNFFLSFSLIWILVSLGACKIATGSLLGRNSKATARDVWCLSWNLYNLGKFDSTRTNSKKGM